MAARFTAIVASLILLASWPSSVAHAAVGKRLKSADHAVDFRVDDSRGQQIARRMLAKEIAENEDVPALSRISTAWVDLSGSKSLALFVMYGCSPTGNCGLYGFERRKGGWRLILNSIAQTCTILPSSHGGRRDLSASMHGSATESTVKTYWWRGNRYVRVPEREVIYR